MGIAVTRRGRVALVLFVGALAGIATHFAASDTDADVLCFLGAGIVLGELLVLRLEDGSALPLSYAVLIVLASSFVLEQYAFTVLAAELIALLIIPSDRGVARRLSTLF